MWCSKLLFALALSISFSANAYAGNKTTHINVSAQYTVENGVTIYRGGLTSAQKTAQQSRRNALLKQRQRQDDRKAVTQQQKKRVQAAYKTGFKNGYSQAQKASISRPKPKYKHKRYGRRYTTSLYGRYGRPYHARRGYTRPQN